jgi:hypothetical protein
MHTGEKLISALVEMLALAYEVQVIRKVFQITDSCDSETILQDCGRDSLVPAARPRPFSATLDSDLACF